jgi:hypothetical protein
MKNDRGATRVARRLWRCPTCGRRFANRQQTHACGRYRLTRHFEGRPRRILSLYRAFVRELRRLGPVTVLPEKTRIAFQVRMSFAQLTPRSRWMDGHLVLARRVQVPCFRKIDTISPRCHVHHFRLTIVEDISPDLRRLMREAYGVGEQRHLPR